MENNFNERDAYLITEISPSLTIAAEVVIELSIALKNCRIYGIKHQIMQKSVKRAFQKIINGFNLKFNLKYNFAKNTIIYEQNYLDKKNPIFTRFASTLWELNITSLELKEGLTLEELLSFINFLNELKSIKEEKAFKNPFKHIIMEFFDVGSLVVKEKREITKDDKKMAEKLWEEFVFSLSETKMQKKETQAVSQSVLHLAKKLSEQAREKEKDYGSAVIDYLKKIDTTYRQKGILSKTELGNKIKTFIETMDPSLRQQILASCLTTEELSPNILLELLQISNIDMVMEALSKLNAESRAIPLTVYRTLTMLSMLEGEEILGKEEALDDFQANEISEDRLQALLDTLLSDDQRFEYTGEEYEEKIEKFQAYADEMAKKSPIILLNHFFQRQIQIATFWELHQNYWSSVKRIQILRKILQEN